MIDAAFGLYHEAYIDSRGVIHVCTKHPLSSVQIEGTDDHVRATEEVRIPGELAKQVSFTDHRMFALTERGNVYTFRID